MINHCTIFRKSDGEIVQYAYFDCPDDVEQVGRNYYARLLMWGVNDYLFIEEPSDLMRQYVVSELGVWKIVNKPELRVFPSKLTLIANGSDAITLSGLPVPCEVIADPEEPEESRITVTGGGFVFTAENPGKYRFRVDRFPFLPLDLEFTAT